MSDYLWNKEGNDEEVAALEKKLSAFSSETSKSPVLKPEPEATLFQQISLFWKLSPVVAASLVLGLFFLMPIEQKIESASVGAGINVSIPNEPIRSKSLQKPIEILPKKTHTETSISKKNNLIVRKRKPKKKRKAPTRGMIRNVPAEKKASAKKPLESITAEERAAYEQLKKALAITSSNLSILKEKVNGDEKAGKPETK